MLGESGGFGIGSECVWRVMGTGGVVACLFPGSFVSRQDISVRYWITCRSCIDLLLDLACARSSVRLVEEILEA
jgi:hypothetical protein